MKPNPLAEPRLSMAYAHNDQSDDVSYDEELGELFPPENPIETKISNHKKLTKKVTKVQESHIKNSASLKKDPQRRSSHSYTIKSHKMESEKKTEEKTSSRKLKRVNTMDLFTEDKKSPDKSSKDKTNKKNPSKVIEEKSKKKKSHSGKIKIEKAPSLNSCPDQPSLARI